MKFRIIEEAWGVNRKTGERKVRRTAERIFTPEAGQIIEFPLGRRRFSIVSADEERVVLRVQCENSDDEKEFIIECGTGGFYNPRSCDGGYRYLFEFDTNEPQGRPAAGRRRGKECRYSIAIKVEKAAGEHDYTQSKFFGSPTVPNEWVERFYDDIIFLAQIRLSDIAEYDPDNILPHSGYLYFFLDAEMYPSDQLYVWVEYYDGEPDTIIDDFNELSPLPCGLNEDWLISFGAAPPDADGTKLLGLPSGAAGSSCCNTTRLILKEFPILRTLTGMHMCCSAGMKRILTELSIRLTEHNRPNKNAETAGTSIRKNT